jgi:maltooligosyltrehalose trehalohydrolase
MPAPMPEPIYPWEQPLGAFPTPDGATVFRVWAPQPERIAVRAGGSEHEMQDAGYGIHEAELPIARGEDYAYVLDGSELPDPCSRWQPAGLHGPSRVLDTRAFTWTDSGFTPPSTRELVIYELHVGVFTEEGTFEAAVPHLEELRELGVTAIELMPIGEFPGNHGWGYDGVYVSAAHEPYGGPLGLQTLVDAAHGAGLAVLLDVVYNHVGASGVKALEAFGPYFTDRYETAWGRAINFDDADCDPVREWVLQSAEQWIRDFHVDGLRLDAIHAIGDSSATHVVQALAGRVHGLAPNAFVIAESGLNDPKVVRSHERGGWGCDAVWADDFHHSLRTLLTGDRDGYYAEFGAVGQLAKAWHRPHVHDGAYSSFCRRRFGARADDVAPERFVVFAQNHDQVGNRALGDRLPEEARPLAALCTLLSPFTPMLFMGEEYGELNPFQFFSDHVDEEIAAATREGRREEFAAFSEFSGSQVSDPQDPATFQASKLSREGTPPGLRQLYSDLLEARRELPAGDGGKVEFHEQEGWFKATRGDHAVLANFSRRTTHVPVDHPVEVLIATHHATVEPGYVVLPPLAGALTR